MDDVHSDQAEGVQPPWYSLPPPYTSHAIHNDMRPLRSGVNQFWGQTSTLYHMPADSELVDLK